MFALDELIFHFILIEFSLCTSIVGLLKKALLHIQLKCQDWAELVKYKLQKSDSFLFCLVIMSSLGISNIYLCYKIKVFYFQLYTQVE